MKKVLHVVKWAWAWLNIAVCVWLLAAAWGVYVSPAKCSWLMPLCLSLPVPLVLAVAFLVFWLVVKWKFCFISLVSLLLVFPSIRTYCPVNLPDPHPKGALHVMTWNVKGFGVSAKVNEEMTAYLLKRDPDILCMQEHVFGRYGAAGKKVVEDMKHWPYQHELSIAPENSLALYSKYPLVGVDTIQQNFHLHGAAAYWLKVGRDTVVVVNCHLVSNSVGPEDMAMMDDLTESVKSGERRARQKAADFLRVVGKVSQTAGPRALQADTIAAYIAGLPKSVPVVVCGDFNDSPNSYAHYRIGRNLADCYVASGLGPGISFNTAPFYFRLDNILCSTHWKATDARVDKSMTCSDHYPLETYLQLREP